MLFVEIRSVAIFPDTLPVLFGSVGQFKCNASGDLTPTIEWWMDDKEVIPDNIHINITHERVVDFTQSSALTYEIVSKVLGGVHTVICRAKNYAGYSDSTATLTVEGMYSVAPLLGGFRCRLMHCPFCYSICNLFEQ